MTSRVTVKYVFMASDSDSLNECRDSVKSSVIVTVTEIDDMQ